MEFTLEGLHANDKIGWSKERGFLPSNALADVYTDYNLERTRTKNPRN